jgi:Zn-dependent protease/CBS domain-containing protein
MRGVRLGSPLGFPLRVDLSWIILFFLVLWSFMTAVFPQRLPYQARSAYLAMGAAAALLFFASLVAHELAHSVVARRKGMRVEGITLFLLGGMAQTRAEAATPRDEFEIAVVGPLMSLAVAAVLAPLALLGARAGLPPALTEVARYVAVLNVALALFNLLPGFPLDGGRVLRAAVWAVSGNATTGTRFAAAAGRVIGYALIAVGLLAAFTGSVVGGLWAVFVGWYLRQAAVSGLEQHMLRGLLARVAATDLMTPDPEVVGPELSLQQLLDQYFVGRGYASLPVVEAGRAIGIITLPRLRAVPHEAWQYRSVREVMLPLSDELCVTPETSLLDIIEDLGRSPARRLLVARDGVLLGIIAPTDVTHWLEGGRRAEAAAVENP